MPELPDITVYIERLRPRIEGRVLEKAQVVSPFLLRTYDPSVDALEGRKIKQVSRLGKRIVWRFDDELFLVLHL
jgi:formamidopyrimidine-DNA glycosylase